MPNKAKIFDKWMIVPVFAAMLSFNGPAMAAADAARGEQLHNEKCTRCHDTGVYTRQDRKVTSLQALEARVRWCQTNLGIQWFDEENADVTLYLNRTFYKFD